MTTQEWKKLAKEYLPKLDMKSLGGGGFSVTYPPRYGTITGLKEAVDTVTDKTSASVIVAIGKKFGINAGCLSYQRWLSELSCNATTTLWFISSSL
jgi:hypothetical protein